MNHAISNDGSLESAYYRRETLASIKDMAQARRDFAAEQILDAFDWKDARDALELAGKKDEPAFEAFCEALAQEGVLCKETHDTVLRIAPPLVITQDELDWAFTRIARVLQAE